MLATPILGIAMMLSKGRPWDFLGIPLPHVSTPDRAFAHNIQQIHETLGNTLMYLTAAHALIALFHHLIQRNGTLKRMLPPIRDGV